MIVRNELQKQVFGAGYPSLPLLTVDEFYQELVQEGALPAPGSKAAKNLNYMGSTQDELEADDVKKERDIEKDDPEHLRNARDYDDWKDGKFGSSLVRILRTRTTLRMHFLLLD